jgi:ABC-2 type transport system ATP-binding protein
MAEMCDAVTVIEHGRVLATGSVQDILERVRKRRVLSVRVSGPLAQLERVLIEQPGVSHVHEAGDRMQFDLDGGDAEQTQLIGRLIAAGIPVLEFTAHGADLEDLFIEITEGRMQ